MVSALSAQDPRLRPLDRRAAADRGACAVRPTDERRNCRVGRGRRAKVGFRRLRAALELARSQPDRNVAQCVSAAARGPILEPSTSAGVACAAPPVAACLSQLGTACINRTPADYATLHRALLTGSLGFIGSKRDVEADAPRPPRASRRRSGRRQHVPSTTGPAECGSGCSRALRCVALHRSGWSRRKSALARRAYTTRGAPMRAVSPLSSRPGSRLRRRISRERPIPSRIGTRSAARRWCENVSRCIRPHVWSRVVRAPAREVDPAAAREMFRPRGPGQARPAAGGQKGSRRHSSTGTRPWGGACRAKPGAGSTGQPVSSRARRHARRSTAAAPACGDLDSVRCLGTVRA